MLPPTPLRAACSASLLVALLAAAAIVPRRSAEAATGRGGATPSAESVRAALLRRLNQERATVGAPPLVVAPALDAAAQEHADEISRRGKLDGRPATADMDERLRRLGYLASEWAEGVFATTGDPAGVVAEFQQRDRNTYRRLLDPSYRDLGIGIGRLEDMALFTFLFAIPEAEQFARRTAGLHDLARVRAEMLAAVAEVRRKANLPPLTADRRLDRAAQGHAEDMLARSYFAHESPEGATVRQRAKAAGYAWRSIGENIAEGQSAVEEVMAAWMKSRPHRANLLDRSFVDLGVGLALGRDPRSGDYRTVWVQEFGLPK